MELSLGGVGSTSPSRRRPPLTTLATYAMIGVGEEEIPMRAIEYYENTAYITEKQHQALLRRFDIRNKSEDGFIKEPCPFCKNVCTDKAKNVCPCYIVTGETQGCLYLLEEVEDEASDLIEERGYINVSSDKNIELCQKVYSFIDALPKVKGRK